MVPKPPSRSGVPGGRVRSYACGSADNGGRRVSVSTARSGWPALVGGGLAVAALLFAACDDGDAAPFELVMSSAVRSESQAEAVAPIGEATNAFAADLYAQLAADSGNLVFSP